MGEFGKLMSQLGEFGERRRFRDTGFEFAIYSYGDYYGVLVGEPSSNEAPDEFTTGYSYLYIFRKSDLDYVGGIAG